MGFTLTNYMYAEAKSQVRAMVNQYERDLGSTDLIPPVELQSYINIGKSANHFIEKKNPSILDHKLCQATDTITCDIDQSDIDQIQLAIRVSNFNKDNICTGYLKNPRQV